ncbi:hypothetical protein Lser_V15G02077 [Lactuca serriola]
MTLQLKGYGHVILFTGETGKKEINTLFNGSQENNVLLLGKWDKMNLENMVMVLNCFFMVSGLKVNIHKSKLYGVGVIYNQVEEMVKVTGCAPGKLPFKYLGLPVAENTSRVRSWQGIIDRYKKKLASWKLKMLSIGGRSMLLSSVLGSLGLYFMIMFLMSVQDLVIAPKDQGGVGIGSLECFNYALLQKWRWCFLTESNSLWRKVIIALHGNCSHPHFGRSSPGNGVWGRIMKSWDIMNDKDVIPYSMALRKIGDGNSTAF